VINLIWLLNCLLTILFYPKGISTETEVSAEVFGIDIVHAVEFSKIGRSRPSASRLSQLGNFPSVSALAIRRKSALPVTRAWSCRSSRCS